jgi:hypothetical protein
MELNSTYQFKTDFTFYFFLTIKNKISIDYRRSVTGWLNRKCQFLLRYPIFRFDSILQQTCRSRCPFLCILVIFHNAWHVVFVSLNRFGFTCDKVLNRGRLMKTKLSHRCFYSLGYTDVSIVLVTQMFLQSWLHKCFYNLGYTDVSTVLVTLMFLQS